MIKKKKEMGKPHQKKEVWKMEQSQAISTEKSISNLFPFLRFFTHTDRASSVSTKDDPLLHDELSEFEKSVISECRKMGMTDTEIEKGKV